MSLGFGHVWAHVEGVRELHVCVNLGPSVLPIEAVDVQGQDVWSVCKGDLTRYTPQTRSVGARA